MSRRPAEIIVLAVLGLLAGFLGTCCDINGVGSPVVEPLIDVAIQDDDEPAKPPEPINLGKTPAEVAMWFLSIPDLAVSILILVASVGLLRMRSWARRLALFCSIPVILLSLAQGGLMIRYWTSSASAEDLPSGPMGSITRATILAFTAALTIIWIVYGAALLIILRRPNIARLFTSGTSNRASASHDSAIGL